MTTFLTPFTILFILGTYTKGMLLNNSLYSTASYRPINDTAQQCGVTNLPSFSDPGKDAPRIQYRQQVLIPSYQFTCCGVVTEWRAYVEPGGDMHTTVYTATFQVWRPEGNGVYTKVGENAYLNPIPLVDSSELSAIQPFIEFQLGDVVGYYLDSTREEENTGVLLDKSDMNQEVYYGPPQEGNTFNTRADGVEEEDEGAPILLVRVG